MSKVKILDHGYLQYIEHWGSDERIIEAARMSTDKGFLGWVRLVRCTVCGREWECENNPAVCTVAPCLNSPTVETHSGDRKLLRHLWIKKHATPFEMAGAIVEVQAPIMVFREWHRHRTQSYNEMSARYTPLPDVNYVPSIERLLMGGDGKNKQAGTVKGADVLTSANAESFRRRLKDQYASQQREYEWALSAGVPKELARIHLPVGRYSRMRASANLRNWLGFLTLRMSDDAQWEIRQYANVLCGLLQNLFPRTLTLFLEGKA